MLVSIFHIHYWISLTPHTPSYKHGSQTPTRRTCLLTIALVLFVSMSASIMAWVTPPWHSLTMVEYLGPVKWVHMYSSCNSRMIIPSQRAFSHRPLQALVSSFKSLISVNKSSIILEHKESRFLTRGTATSSSSFNPSSPLSSTVTDPIKVTLPFHIHNTLNLCEWKLIDSLALLHF